MRIAYIIPSLAAKAPIFLAKSLSDFFRKRGHYVKVFFFDEKYGTSFDCECERINLNRPISFDDFDIIHSHMMRPDKYVSFFSKSIKKAKTVSTIHCNIKEDLNYSYGNFISYVFTKRWIGWLKTKDATVQINEYLMRLYEDTFKNNILIYNGISLSSERDNYDDIISKIHYFKGSNLSILCTYSSLIERKGLLQILKVLINRPDLSYICIGEGKQKEDLVEFAKDNNILDRVYFSPFKKNPYNVLPLVDVFLIPSYSEGFSLALLEAGLIGASVVCSDIPAFSFPFSKEEVTFFTLNDISGLSNAIDVALSSRTSKSLFLKKKIKDNYSEENMFNKYDDLYKTLIST